MAGITENTQAETRVPDTPPPIDGPLSPEQAVPTLIMFFIAMLGGFVAFYRKVREGKARAFNFTELVGELFISGISGVFAYWLFKGMNVNPWLIAAGVGIAGHMGSRALFMAEQIIGDIVRKKYMIVPAAQVKDESEGDIKTP